MALVIRAAEGWKAAGNISVNYDMQFAIYQNDKTRLTHVYNPNTGWIMHPPVVFEQWKDNAEFMRKYPMTFCQTLGIETPDPINNPKPLPPHIPGFFIPPEELDGLE
jgi:hypothetical protein